MSVKKPGDPMAIGDEITFMEPDGPRIGRIVGFYKDGRAKRIIYRQFRDGDGRWPTGDWRVTAGIGLLPFNPEAHAAVTAYRSRPLPECRSIR